jgi:peptide chain release factor 2
MQEITRRKTWVESWTTIHRKLRDAETLLELAIESSDQSLGGEIQSEIAGVEKGIADLEFRNMLSGEDDSKNCVLNIHSGAGGTESQDWAEMLLRMYLRW